VVVILNSSSGILNFTEELIFFEPEGNFYLATLGEFDRIVHDVIQNLLHPLFVDIDIRRKPRSFRYRKFNSLSLGLKAVNFKDRADSLT
jgi:hypothetical protein